MSATVAAVNASIGRDRPCQVKFVIGPDTALPKKLIVPVGGHCPFTSTALDSPAISRLSDPGSTESPSRRGPNRSADDVCQMLHEARPKAGTRVKLGLDDNQFLEIPGPRS